jgi:hypothetical protein
MLWLYVHAGDMGGASICGRDVEPVDGVNRLDGQRSGLISAPLRQERL